MFVKCPQIFLCFLRRFRGCITIPCNFDLGHFLNHYVYEKFFERAADWAIGGLLAVTFGSAVKKLVLGGHDHHSLSETDVQRIAGAVFARLKKQE